LVAVLLEIAVELDGFEKSMTLGGDLVDGKILGPTEVRIHALQVLCGEGDFHSFCSWLCINEPQPAFPLHGRSPASASSRVWFRGGGREKCCRSRIETRACRGTPPSPAAPRRAGRTSGALRGETELPAGPRPAVRANG